MRGRPLAPGVQRARDGLAQNIEPPLEFVLRGDLASAPEKDLHVPGLGRLDRFAERRVVGRDVAPAEDFHAFLCDDRRVGVGDFSPPCVVVRQEQRADGVMPGRRQREAKFGCFLGEEFVRRLHQDAGAVAGARIGADRAAMFEVDQDGQRVLDDLVRLAPLDVGNETDAAGSLFLRRIEEPKALRAHRHFRAPLVAAAADAEVFRHIIRHVNIRHIQYSTHQLSRAVSALPRPSAVKDGVGHAPEGEPLFWRQPSCRLAAFNYRYAIVVARLPRSGAPSPSAAGPRASLPAPMSSPRFGERTGTGRARSGHPIRTVILSYAKHGRSRANAQGRTFLRLFAAAERPGRRIKAYGFGLCGSVFRNVLRGQVDHGLCASAMPESVAAAD